MKSLDQLIKRWDVILQEHIKALPARIDRYKNIKRNAQGHFTGSLRDHYADLARLEYLLHKDVNAFKTNLVKATEYELEICELAAQGKFYDECHFTMDHYEQLLDALASGDIEIAKKLANYIGGRPEIEATLDNDFQNSFGYALKYCVEGWASNMPKHINIACKACRDVKDYGIPEFIGYPLVLEAIYLNDVVKANESFNILIEGHKKKCSKYYPPDCYPITPDTPDADLFVWGVALANLCRYYGLEVVSVDPIVPEELLMPVMNNKLDYDNNILAFEDVKKI